MVDGELKVISKSTNTKYDLVLLLNCEDLLLFGELNMFGLIKRRHRGPLGIVMSIFHHFDIFQTKQGLQLTIIFIVW